MEGEWGVWIVDFTGQSFNFLSNPSGEVSVSLGTEGAGSDRSPGQKFLIWFDRKHREAGTSRRFEGGR